MADPSTPDGGDTIGPLPHRAAAAAVDLAAVLLPSFLFVRTAAERFPVETLIDGTKRFSDEDRVRVEEIGQGFNRTLELDGVLYTLSGIGLWIVLVCSAAVAALVYVVVPDRSGGRTPGKRVFGLRTVDEYGGAASIGALAVRTLVGIVDLVPFVIPGALGAYLAAKDESGRRLGDRVAHTVVVVEGDGPDDTDGDWFTYRGTMIGRGDDGPGDDAVDLGSRLSTITAPAPTATIARPSTQPADDPADDELDEDLDPDEWLEPEEESEFDEPVSAEQETAMATGAPVALVDPMDRPFLDEMFEPLEPADVTPDEILDAGPEGLSDNEADDAEFDPDPDLDPDFDPDAGFEDKPPAMETAESEPESEPEPEPESDVEIAAEAASSPEPEAESEPEMETDRGPSESSRTTEPEWNEAWKAWMYWDRDSKRWFRHDEASGKWRPLP